MVWTSCLKKEHKHPIFSKAELWGGHDPEAEVTVTTATTTPGQRHPRAAPSFVLQHQEDNPASVLSLVKA